MTNVLKLPRWSPYVVGTGIGVLSWVTFALMGKALGTSTSMVHAAGALEGTIAAEHVQNNAYYGKYIVSSADSVNPIVDWQVALVLMLAVGAFIAARLSGQRRVEHVPSIWWRAFGRSRALRYTAAFVGGAVLLIGARLAGGCTSGHGISGGLQLAVSSWIFLGAMFVTGVPAAFLLYNRRARDGSVAK